MTIRVYAWDDASAPQLDGTPGSMAALLKAVFVDGYGSKPAMGWDYMWDSVTNQRIALRSADLASTRLWLYVDDTGTIGAGGGRWARAWGAESFTGWDVGTGAALLTDTFPVSSFGRTVAKHITDGAVTTSPWIIVASPRSFYLFVDYYLRSGFPHSKSSPAGAFHFFGDVLSSKPSDPFCFAVAGGSVENNLNDFVGSAWLGCCVGGSVIFTVARDYTGITKSVDAAIYNQMANVSYSAFGLNGAAYPDPISGGVLLTKPVAVYASLTSSPWASYPGLLVPFHPVTSYSASFPLRHTITHESRTWQFFILCVTGRSGGGVYIDTTGPWYV